jgi:xylulokinase
MAAPSEERSWVNCAYIPRGTWLGIGTTTSAGASVDWFARELLGGQGADGDALARMTELASRAPAGANGVLFLPYLQGERTSVWDSLARGSFFGLTAGTTLADLARAVFEGVAFALRQVLEARPAGGAVAGVMRAVGGGTRNALWNRIKADVLGFPLAVLDFQETGALGAALLGGTGAGVCASFEEAARVGKATGGATVVEPDRKSSAVYGDLFAAYSELYPRTKGIMHRLAGARADRA